MAKKSQYINPNHLLTKQEVKDTIKRLGFNTAREFQASIGISESNWSNLSQISKTLILMGCLIDKLGFKNFIEVIDEVEVLKNKIDELEKTIRGEDMIRLTEEEWEKFKELLDKQTEPTEELKKLMNLNGLNERGARGE